MTGVGVRLAAGLLGLVVGSGHSRPVWAQLASPNTTGSTATCNTNDGNGSCSSSVNITTNTAATVASRFGWNVGADVGSGGTADRNSSATDKLAFSATAPGSYRLDITSSIAGVIVVRNDALNCSGSADMTAVTGTSNIALTSGSLSLGDPGSQGPNGGGTTVISASTPATILRSSNGAAQAHQLTYTWSGTARSNSCEGAVRLGENTGAVTGCDACGYPGNPSRTQANDGLFVTVNYTSLCGNGVIDAGANEQCDAGGANGLATSCCTSNCQFRTAGLTCRASAGICDTAEVCPANPGTGGACPGDVLVANGTPCRGSAGVCDPAEACTGASAVCPADAKTASGTVCRAAVTAIPPTVTCDIQEVCDGSSNDCPVDSFKASGVSCRTSVDLCDSAEVCTGSAATCPTDSKFPIGHVCHGSTGPCDPQEICNGSSDTCPTDVLSPSGTPCRFAQGICDLEEDCSGVSAACPADAKAPPDQLCRASADGEICDPIELCDGVSDNCPADAFQPSTTICRADQGTSGPGFISCDAVEFCTGSGPGCPTDLKKPSSTVCRPDVGANIGADFTCDVAENCTGAANNCPANGFKPANTLCRTGSGDPNSSGFICDPNETCTGGSTTCPPEFVVAAGTVCNNGTSVDDASRDAVCDPNETCTGIADQPCPADTITAVGTVCDNGSGDMCDPNETCTGIADQPCPSDVVVDPSVICNMGTSAADASRDNVCDPDEYCPGVAAAFFGDSSAKCPPDTIAPMGTLCDHGSGDPNGSGSICDPDETCSGTADVACPPDFVRSSSFICNAGTSTADASRDAVCDPDEKCPGTPAAFQNDPSSACPADTYKPAGFVCGIGTDLADSSRDDICDPQETCSGNPDSACPANVIRPVGTVCSFGSGAPNGGSECDPQEVCSGVSHQPCPTDVFAPSNTVCRGDAGDCDVPDFCPGTNNGVCPPNAFEAANTLCGSSTDNDCTNPDQCDGLGVCLPKDEPADTPCFGPAANSNGRVPTSNTCKFACNGGGSCATRGAPFPNCCGNGIPGEPGELCDDGNQFTGASPAPDGSTESCPSDVAFNCTYTAGGSSLWIRGNRKNPSKDLKGCQHEFFVVNPSNPKDKYLLPNYFQSCLDQDPTCDSDPTPGRCGFVTVVCANTNDSNLPACSPTGLTSIEVLPQHAALGNQIIAAANAANTAAIQDAVIHLFDPNNPGAGFSNTAPISAAQTDMCSLPKLLTVFAASARSNESARARFTLRTKSKDTHTPLPRTKRALLRLTCVARPL